MVIRPRAAIKIRHKINYKVWGEVRYKRGTALALQVLCYLTPFPVIGKDGLFLIKISMHCFCIDPVI